MLLFSDAIHIAAGGVKHVHAQIGIICGKLISMQNIIIIKQWTFIEKYYLNVYLAKNWVNKLGNGHSQLVFR